MTMKQSISFFSFSLFSFLLFSQGIGPGWDGSIGDETSTQIGYSITIDSLDNVITVGTFEDSIDMDPGAVSQWLYAQGSRDLFIQKLDSSGNFVWGKRIGGSGYMRTLHVRVDKLGNIYCPGAFNGTIDFDPGLGVMNLTSAAGGDYFLLKLTPNGNFVWAKRLGGIGGDMAASLVIDANGSPIILGILEDIVDVDPGPAVLNLGSPGELSMLVQKLNSSGDFQWAKVVEGEIFGRAITLNSMGEIYITGTFEDSIDFDPGPNQFYLQIDTMRNLFVQKLDSSGNFIWVEGIGGVGRNLRASGIVVDKQDNIVISGWINNGSDSIDVDPGPGYFPVSPYDMYPSDSNTFGAGFISKWDSARNLVWFRQFVGEGDTGDGGRAGILEITMDSCGSIYGIGNSDNSVVLAPGKMDLSDDDPLFIVKLDQDGNEKWLHEIGGNVPYLGFGIALSKSGDIAFTGSYSLSDGTSPYEPQALIRRVSQIPIILIDKFSITACDSYTSPWGQVYTSSGLYTEVVTACNESINYSIDLTIESHSVGHVVDSACSGSSYLLNDEVYMTAGIYTQILTNAVGCDSTLTLDLSFLPAMNTTINQMQNQLMVIQQNATYQWLDCNDGHNPIVGANGQSFVPSQSGSYAVIVENGTCSDTSDCYLFSTVGIDRAFASEIRHYPNPNAGRLTIQLGQVYQNIQLEIWNTLGQRVEKLSVDHTETVQTILPEETGMYLIHVIADERRAVLKVMRE